MLFKGDAYAKIITNGEELDFSSLGEDSRRLALDFSVNLTVDSDPNDGEISIYNLGETSRNKISQDGTSVEVYAGYETLKLIGKGSIKNVSNEKLDIDWRTTISFGDGQKEYTESSISKSYKKGIRKKSIISDIVNAMGLSSTGDDAFTGKTEGAMIIDGLCKDVLTEKTKDWGVDWSIQDGEIIFTKEGKENDRVEAVIIKASTGLLEHPDITERGVKFRTQLNPDLRPKSVVKLEPISSTQSNTETKVGGERAKPERNPSATGAYICEKVTFSGNNYGGAFDTTVDARRIE
jgi:hypothetical protein